MHPARALREKDAVFIGVALPDTRSVAVLRSWRRQLSRTVRLFFADPHDIHALLSGQQYLVYANRTPNGSYEGFSCQVRLVRYVRAEIAWLDAVAANRTPANSVIVRPWPERTFRALRLRNRTTLIALQNVGVGQYYADNVPPGEYLLETGEQGYRLREPWIFSIGPGSNLYLSPEVVGARANAAAPAR